MFHHVSWKSISDRRSSNLLICTVYQTTHTHSSIPSSGIMQLAHQIIFFHICSSRPLHVWVVYSMSNISTVGTYSDCGNTNNCYNFAIMTFYTHKFYDSNFQSCQCGHWCIKWHKSIQSKTEIWFDRNFSLFIWVFHEIMMCLMQL